MYSYNAFDTEFVKLRAAQYRDQLERRLDGRLSEEEFRPLRLQNGWYVQRYAPMLRVAIPYGELNTAQLRVLARIAREFDQPTEEVFQKAVTGQARLSGKGIELTKGYGHFTTRQNIQFNWIPLEKSADVMDLLASVNMHGIQTSGNCIRNITSDALAGIAPDEIADPRPWCEILRQWSTLHPEFAFLPRKFKIAVTGAEEDRAATYWHDVGLQLIRNDAGELGFKVLVGGGMGRTPVIATVIREFLPALQILNYLEAIVRVYNLFGRRDNKYKARIKILVKAEGQKYIDQVEAEFASILAQDAGPHTLTQSHVEQISQHFEPAVGKKSSVLAINTVANKVQRILDVAASDDVAFTRWVQRNVHAHANPALRAVTLSVKRVGQAPGDVTPEQMEAAAAIADQFSHGELRVTHDQNLLLPWVSCDVLPQLWRAAKKACFASSNIGLLSDMIACPGGDFCDLANARSLPIAAEITERYQDLDELEDLGEIDLHMSGCINSCGHHHSGHIGILGVDKDGQEWYQLTLGGSDGSQLSGAPAAGKVVGPSFSAAEIPDAIEAVLGVYKNLREPRANSVDGDYERFIDTLKRIGQEPFKAAANAARHVQHEVA
jgi:sulfite reductase (NADPH) hemoprotein beta-component